MKRLQTFIPAIVVLAVLVVPAGIGARAQPPDPRTRLLEAIDSRQQVYADVALQIWKFAEPGFLEEKSSALLQERLAAAGFSVRKGVAGIPTAFVASFGTGRPVIAFVGEFDALPGLSQDAVPARKVLISGGPGHGCGHNLLGTASLAAAVAVRDWLAASGRAGTVRYYGTPRRRRIAAGRRSTRSRPWTTWST